MGRDRREDSPRGARSHRRDRSRERERYRREKDHHRDYRERRERSGRSRDRYHRSRSRGRDGDGRRREYDRKRRDRSPDRSHPSERQRVEAKPKGNSLLAQLIASGKQLQQKREQEKAVAATVATTTSIESLGDWQGPAMPQHYQASTPTDEGFGDETPPASAMSRGQDTPPTPDVPPRASVHAHPAPPVPALVGTQEAHPSSNMSLADPADLHHAPEEHTAGENTAQQASSKAHTKSKWESSDDEKPKEQKPRKSKWESSDEEDNKPALPKKKKSKWESSDEEDTVKPAKKKKKNKKRDKEPVQEDLGDYQGPTMPPQAVAESDEQGPSLPPQDFAGGYPEPEWGEVQGPAMPGDEDVAGPSYYPEVQDVQDFSQYGLPEAPDASPPGYEAAGDEATQQAEGGTRSTSDAEGTEQKEPASDLAVHLLDACRSVDNYKRLGFIDEGTFGQVFKASDKESGQVYALKRVKMHSEAGGFPITALREVNVLLTVRHPNIVPVREMVIGSSLDQVFMVMDFMDRDLKAVMESREQPLSASEVKGLMQQLLAGLSHLHRNWLFHRDLKTSNLLLNADGTLCIADFGLARRFGNPVRKYTQPVVTLWYRAPELLLGVKEYGPEIDMWSVGCIFAEFLTRKPLFPGKGESDQLQKIFGLCGTPSEEEWPEFHAMPRSKSYRKVQRHAERFRKILGLPTFAVGALPYLSPAGLDLLWSMLQLNPDNRISAEDALSHPYFSEAPAAKPLNLEA